LGNIRYTASASIGAVTFDGSERKIDDVLRRADLAMYEVKTGHRDGIGLGGPAEAIAGASPEVGTELQEAIGKRELRLFLQPQLDRVGRVVGAEGLLRWPRKQGGLLLPDQFVPLAS